MREAEVLWGSEALELVKPVRACQIRLSQTIREYLRYINREYERVSDSQREDVEARLWASTDEDDPVSTAIRDSLAAILDVAEPKLRR